LFWGFPRTAFSSFTERGDGDQPSNLTNTLKLQTLIRKLVKTSTDKNPLKPWLYKFLRNSSSNKSWSYIHSAAPQHTGFFATKTTTTTWCGKCGNATRERGDVYLFVLEKKKFDDKSIKKN
jgi:hypothetical protein